MRNNVMYIGDGGGENMFLPLRLLRMNSSVINGNHLSCCDKDCGHDRGVGSSLASVIKKGHGSGGSLRKSTTTTGSTARTVVLRAGLGRDKVSRRREVCSNEVR